MFLLLAGPGSAAVDGVPEGMARELRGGRGAARLWRAEGRDCAAASAPSDFVPEDEWDMQPLVKESRIFVCQARLDNRSELLERLGLGKGKALADSAVLAEAYDRWGEGCLDRLVGDYAFAAWHRDGRVVAAVDPLGARRLFWIRIGGGIALSAQLPSLLAHPEVSRQPDFAAIVRLLDAGIDRGSTPFAAVRALPGGNLLTWKGGDPKIERWWRPEDRPTLWYRDPADYAAEAGELLARAVSAQLRSSGPVSSTLSGGLDSGCVTALAARLMSSGGDRLTAYTSVPEEGLAVSQRPNWEADDRHYAAEVAALYGNVDHRLVPPGGRCTPEVSRSVHRRSLTPTKSATNLLWIEAIAGSMARAGSRVLLLGQHGNPGFSSAGRAPVWELAVRARPFQAFRQASLEARGRQRSLPWILAGAVRDGVRGAWGGRSRDVGPAVRFLKPHRRPSQDQRRNEHSLPPGSRAFSIAFMTTPKHVWWPDPVLQWGIEYRDPTADRRLLERLLRYPQAAFRLGGRPRGLARELAVDLLPERVRLRRTQGAQVPEAPALIGVHAGRYRAELARMAGSTWCRELLDLPALGRCVDRFAAGSTDYYAALPVDRAMDVGQFLAGLEGGS